MNWNYIYHVLPQFVQAALITLELSFWAWLLSLIVGLISSLILYYRLPFIEKLVRFYIELARNTPLLIQVFFLYFGLSKIGIHLSGFICALIALVFLGGAYMAEALRAGLESTRTSQIDTGKSLGLNTLQILRYIILPQSLAVSLPAIGANTLFLIKETSVVSAVAVAELMFVAKDLIGIDYKTNEALFLLVVFYLIILLPVSILVRYLEIRQRSASHGI